MLREQVELVREELVRRHQRDTDGVHEREEDNDGEHNIGTQPERGPCPAACQGLRVHAIFQGQQLTGRQLSLHRDRHAFDLTHQ